MLHRDEISIDSFGIISRGPSIPRLLSKERFTNKAVNAARKSM
jgi:hypothetical protein